MLHLWQQNYTVPNANNLIQQTTDPAVSYNPHGPSTIQVLDLKLLIKWIRMKQPYFGNRMYFFPIMMYIT